MKTSCALIALRRALPARRLKSRAQPARKTTTSITPRASAWRRVRRGPLSPSSIASIAISRGRIVLNAAKPAPNASNAHRIQRLTCTKTRVCWRLIVQWEHTPIPMPLIISNACPVPKTAHLALVSPSARPAQPSLIICCMKAIA